MHKFHDHCREALAAIEAPLHTDAMMDRLVAALEAILQPARRVAA